MSRLLSTLTVASVGLTCKTVLNLGLISAQTSRLNVLLDALENARRKGTGVVTGVC